MSSFQSPSDRRERAEKTPNSLNSNNNSSSKADLHHDNGPAAFFRRLQKGVSDTVSGVGVARPIPGIIRMNPTTKSPIVTNNNPRETLKVSTNGAANAIESFDELHSKSTKNVSDSAKKSSTTEKKTPTYRLAQFEKILQSDTVDIKALRRVSWNGIPSDYRTEVWQMLLGYLPINKERRDPAIVRKRKEFQDSIPVYYNISEADRTTQEGEILRQILVDMPRTCPNTPFFHQAPIQLAMERILYIWAIRHPASGYVQGMSDLLTPLFLVCVQPFAADPLRCDVAALDSAILADIEADVYWCFSKLLDNIQDHYTFSQPGLQRMGIQYMQFSFRWMNCILLRELPLRAIMRVWDTYLSEEEGGFENFHVYVCAVFLKTYRETLLSMQFQDILMFLQDLPTSDWTEEQ
eukprot:gene25123-32767_t